MPFESTHVYQYTINLSRVHLMPIFKENHLNTLVSIYRYKQKPPYDTLIGESSRLRNFRANRFKIEGGVVLVEVILGIGFPVSQPQSLELKRHPEKDGTIIRAFDLI